MASAARQDGTAPTAAPPLSQQPPPTPVPRKSRTPTLARPYAARIDALGRVVGVRNVCSACSAQLPTRSPRWALATAPVSPCFYCPEVTVHTVCAHTPHTEHVRNDVVDKFNCGSDTAHHRCSFLGLIHPSLQSSQLRRRSLTPRQPRPPSPRSRPPRSAHPSQQQVHPVTRLFVWLT